MDKTSNQVKQMMKVAESDQEVGFQLHTQELTQAMRS